MVSRTLRQMVLPVLAISIGMIASISSAVAATATATVGATIFGSINASTVLNMNFGALSAGPTAGTVIITATGLRSSTGGVGLNSGSFSSPATLLLVGIPNASFAISLPSSITISDGSNTMMVDNFVSVPSGTGQLDASGNQTLTIGGTLNVFANQPIGNYQGIMTVVFVYN